MNVYPKFLQPDYFDDGITKEIIGWDILWFRTWHFFFRWFTDCGDWFVYLEWRTRKAEYYMRFSSAGFMKGKFDKNA